MKFGIGWGFAGHWLSSKRMTNHGSVIVEFISVGQLVKVTAVCELTGREVSMVGDPRVSREELKRLAVKKLRYVLNKEAGPNSPKRRGLNV